MAPQVPKGGAPEGWGSRRVGLPKGGALFSVSHHQFRSFFLSGVFSWNFGGGALKCAPRKGGPQAGASHHSTRAQTCTFEGPHQDQPQHNITQKSGLAKIGLAKVGHHPSPTWSEQDHPWQQQQKFPTTCGLHHIFEADPARISCNASWIAARNAPRNTHGTACINRGRPPELGLSPPELGFPTLMLLDNPHLPHQKLLRHSLCLDSTHGLGSALWDYNTNLRLGRAAGTNFPLRIIREIAQNLQSVA